MHYKPFSKSLTFMSVDNSVSNSLPIYSEDAVLPTTLIARNNFSTVPLEPAVEIMDESLDAMKSSRYIHFNNHLNTTTSFNSTIPAISYTAVLDPFRADYEDVV